MLWVFWHFQIQEQVRGMLFTKKVLLNTQAIKQVNDTAILEKFFWVKWFEISQWSKMDGEWLQI